MVRTLFFAVALFAATHCASAAENAGDETADNKHMWNDVAKSAVIAVGHYNLSDADKNSLGTSNRTYLGINLKLVEILKGAAPEKALLRYFIQVTSYLPNPSEILSLNDKQLILFLSQPHISAPEQLYLESSSPLQPASADSIDALKVEIRRQQQVLDNWKADTSVSGYKKVQRILKKIRSPKSQATAFAELEKLGMDGVPAMIMLMDDRTPLPLKSISLSNKAPDSFEGLRHYGPSVRVEAIAAILNQITGYSFGFIYNGATEDERRAEINGWRIYYDALKAGKVYLPHQ